MSTTVTTTTSSTSGSTSVCASSSSSLKLLVKCDYPEKTAVIHLAETETVSGLISAIANQFQSDVSQLQLYEFLAAQYGHDIIQLSHGFRSAASSSTSSTSSASSSGSSPFSSPSCSLSSLGVFDRATIFLRAPLEMLPETGRKKRMKKNNENGTNSSSTTSSEFEIDEKYRGLTVYNIFRRFKDNQKAIKSQPFHSALIEKSKLYYSFFDEYFNEIWKNNSEDFCSLLNSDDLCELYQRETLAVKEIDLLQAALAWAEYQIKKHLREEKLQINWEKKTNQNNNLISSSSPPTLKTLMSPFLHLIRLPLLTADEIAKYVCNNDLLDEEMLLDLFTFVGKGGIEKEAKAAAAAVVAASAASSAATSTSSAAASPAPVDDDGTVVAEDDAANVETAIALSLIDSSSSSSSSSSALDFSKLLPSSLSAFKCDPRRAARSSLRWKWSLTMKHASITCTDGYTTTCYTTSYYCPIFGEKEFTCGIHEWEIVLTSLATASNTCCIGVVRPAAYGDYSASKLIGVTHYMDGYAYNTTATQKSSLAGNVHYGKKCVTGDIVKVRLNLDKKTIEFFVNGASQGIAFTDVQSPVRPALTLYSNVSCTLKFPK